MSTAADNRALRASIAERDRLYAAAFEAGTRGEPYDPEWPESDDVADAYRAGLDERQARRLDRRAARFEGYRRRARRAARGRQGRRVRRWARRHPFVAAAAVATFLAMLVALGALAGIALAARRVWRGLAWLVRAARAALDARRSPPVGTAPAVALEPGEDPF